MSKYPQPPSIRVMITSMEKDHTDSGPNYRWFGSVRVTIEPVHIEATVEQIEYAIRNNVVFDLLPSDSQVTP